MYLCWLIYFITTPILLSAQKKEDDDRFPPNKLFIKVHAIDKIYKGRLYYVSDSAVWVFTKANKKLPEVIRSGEIDFISFKRKHGVLKGMLEGAGGGFLLTLLVLARFKAEGDAEGSILPASFAGAGLGMIVGGITARSVKISITISRKQWLFAKQRERLQKFVY